MKHILTVVEHERVRKGKSALSPLLRGILNGPLAINKSPNALPKLWSHGQTSVDFD
jgi:hypothetical protein